MHGQVAVVTGAGRGLGRAFAQALAAAGASVGLIARSVDELAETAALIHGAGGQARAAAADVADAGAVRQSFASIEEAFGAVDVLVNNAGIGGPIGPLGHTDTEDWWRVMEVNLRGPMVCSAALVGGMMDRGRGRIINIASSPIPIPHFSAYSTSKTALIRFTECLAAETKARGVFAFSVVPGTIRTAMSEHSMNSPEGQKWLPWFRRIFDEGMAVPADVPARLVVRLASGEADALTGLCLSPADDLAAIQASMEEVQRDKLYSMRLRGLAAAAGNPTLAAIRAAAEKA